MMQDQLNKNAEQSDISWRHALLIIPNISMMVCGFLIGWSIAPFIYGLRGGYRHNCDFWQIEEKDR